MAPIPLPPIYHNRTYLGITLGCSLTSQKLLKNPKMLSTSTFGQSDLSLHVSQLHGNFALQLYNGLWPKFEHSSVLVFPFAEWVHLWPNFTYLVLVEVSYLWCEPVNPQTKVHCATKKPMNVSCTYVNVFNRRCNITDYRNRTFSFRKYLKRESKLF